VDLAQIKAGKVGAVVASLTGNIALHHENVTIDTSYTENGKAVNDGSSFAIKSLDYIKCTDTATKQKALTIPISLDPAYNWSSSVTPEMQNKNILCAEDYYPQIDKPTTPVYSPNFGPGEFDLKNIASAGPQAAQQKIAQVVGETMTSNATVADEGQKDLLPAAIEIPTGLFTKNLKTGDSSFSDLMQSLNQDLRNNKKKNVKITPSDGVGAVIVKTI
jgi:hypothetical protein